MTEKSDPGSRVKPSACPSCGKMLDGATNCIGGGRPRGGDFSVCLYCAAFLRFTRTMCLEKATDADLVALGENAQLRSSTSPAVHQSPMHGYAGLTLLWGMELRGCWTCVILHNGIKQQGNENPIAALAPPKKKPGLRAQIMV